MLYGTKSPVNQQFKVLGHVPLRSLITENAEHNTFLIYGGQRAITVSASTTAEKTLWLAELSRASTDIKSKPHVQLSLGALNHCSKAHFTKKTSKIKKHSKFYRIQIPFFQAHQKKVLRHAAFIQTHQLKLQRQLNRWQRFAVIVRFMFAGTVGLQLA